MLDKEKLIAEIMRDAEKDGEPLTREDAEYVADLEIKGKDVKILAQSDKPKSKKPKERKVDEEKLHILKGIKILLEGYGYEVDLEKEVALHFGEFSLKLTRHRPPKK